ncbi:hypothetical protein MUN82_11910 [Hymenobacter aerilatus]|uniref:Altered inheritance of mitochondria protein 6 n=1 Tax=Hymenobacter aerilatus TaxID=2932251 RepID=A0A8T9SRK4_9BACT|nr:hypothetical protein [Hymenobacter aerilatus]UOR03654.1 hypothetical protein MUN82_11910 [Hymenobacter aerilatus]
MIKTIASAVLTALLLTTAAHTQTPHFQPAPPLEQGHSHNDYWRPHPLFDALQLGFKSVEADVFLVDSTMQVGHERAALHPTKTLQSLYLDPLRQLNGQLYTKPAELWLYVDFKNDGEATYAQLHKVLSRYRNMLSTPQQPRAGGVRVILTGGYPRQRILADPNRLVFLDGQLTDLQAGLAANIPTVNGNWKKTFRWDGVGKMPAAEATRLRQLNDQAVRTGQKVRFWDLPASTVAQRQAVWQELLRYPALLVGADELVELKQVIDKQR